MCPYQRHAHGRPLSPWRHRGRLRSLLAAFLMSAVAVSPVQATVGPPVKISMPPDSKPAVAGQPYAGVFEVRLGRAGVLSDFQLEGQGWTVRSFEPPANGAVAGPGVIRIPFTATPADPAQLLRLRLRFDGRPVSRSLRLGAAAFARRGRGRAALQVVPGTQKGKAGSTPSRTAGTADTLTFHFIGRVVYERPGNLDGNNGPIWFGSTYEGVDRIRVRIKDDDGAIDDTVWEGFTDTYGYFDTGVFSWEDCDPLCENEPDLYVEWECDTDIVNVQDAEDITQPDFTWDTEDVLIYEDFNGGFIDFGTWTPGTTQEMPPLHIHNSITRAHRFIFNQSGLSLNLPELDVLWPVDDTNAFYDGEINLPHSREWVEDTHTHEYGHHFLESFAENVEPEYCNGLNFCDGDLPCAFDGCDKCTSPGDCDNPGHCLWCPETDHDAWNEGFPNWLADIVTRDYPFSYQFDDGRRYEALRTRDLESLNVCCQDGQVHPPLITEGYIGALLRDIEDGTAYDGTTLQDDHDDDGICDCLELAYDEIFHVVTLTNVITPSDFLSSFISLYPQHMPGLYSTAYNVHPDFVAGIFPADTQPPGVPQSATSPSHPPFVGGTSPCIEVHLGPVPDDVTGACAYSVVWSSSPDGIEPDFTEDVQGSCCIVSHTREPGSHYVSLRARDCAGHWSSEWTTFGPFTVTECNGNGILDICEIPCSDVCPCDVPDNCAHMCDASLLASDPQRQVRLKCQPHPDYCQNLYGGVCGLGRDCNLNLVPDDCDIASGASSDCNEDGIPDECQDMARWVGGTGVWQTPSSWEDASGPTGLPGANQHVCIDGQPDVTVTNTTGVQSIRSLSCHDHLILWGTLTPDVDITLAEPSFVRGDLRFLGSRNITLRNNLKLTVSGKLTLAAAGSSGAYLNRLVGLGILDLEGGMEMTANTFIDAKMLRLRNSSFATATRGFSLANNAVFRIESGSTLDFQAEGGTGGAGEVFSGTTGKLEVQGQFLRSMGNSEAHITCRVENSGQMRVQSGTLRLARGGSHTGQLIADPGTILLIQGGQHEFLAGSSIVAPDVEFASGISGENRIRGIYHVSNSTKSTGHHTYFEPSADVIDYGDHLIIDGGTLHLNHSSGQSRVFQTVLVDGALDCAGSDPIVTASLTLGHAGGGGSSLVSGPGSVTVNDSFTWLSVGTFFNHVSVHVNGQLLIVPSTSVRNLDGDSVLNNAGYATFQGAIGCRGNGKFNNLPGGTVDITMDGNIITRESALPTDNAGIIVKTAGAGTSNIDVDVNNTGTVEVRVGELEFGRFYIQTAGQTFLNGGHLRKSDFHPSIKKPAQIQGGSLRGAGTVTGDVEIAVCTPGPCSAQIIPGTSIGTLNIVGNYTHGAGGTLRIELGGLTAGTEHDQLTVSGTATLQGGTVDVAPFGGFIPQVGQQFVILTAGSVTGTFSGVTGPGAYTLTHNPTNVTLTVTQAPCAQLVGPDFDLDCDVDADDVLAFINCASRSGVAVAPGCEPKDLDGDQDADLADFARLQRCYAGEGIPADPNCGD